MKKVIAGINIIFVLNLMSGTSYTPYIVMDLVIIGLNVILMFKDEK